MAGTYSQYSIPQLWASLQGEDNDGVWRTVNAWQQTAQAVDVHIGVLRQAREELIAAWPPQGSEAATSFVNYIDNLILSMDTTADRAASNYTALSHIVTGVVVAKQEMQPLYEAWKQANPAGDARLHAPTGSTPQSAIQQLVAKAWAVMEKADARITEAVATMEAPPRYEPIRGDIDYTNSNDRAADAGANGASIGAGYSTAYAQQPVIPAPVSVDGSATLTGTTTTLTSSPPSGSPTVPTATSGNSLPSRPSGQPPIIGALAPVGSLIPGNATLRPGAQGVAPRQLVAPGGTIGGTSPAGTTRAMPSTVTQRVMSPGGVIGSSQSGQSGQGARPGILSQPGVGGLRRDDEKRQRFDPDEPWLVKEGVPPVLEAPPEQARHDPGPGVIGIDR